MNEPTETIQTMNCFTTLTGFFCSLTLMATVQAQKIDRNAAVKKGNAIKAEAGQKSKAALRKATQSPAVLLDVVGYYMGGKTNAEGRFEAEFLIEREGEDKDQWPTITLTGELYREICEGLNQYHRVALNLADGHAEPMAVLQRKDRGAEEKDWDAAYERLLERPAIRDKILGSGATKEQVIEFLKKQAVAKKGKGKGRMKANMKPGARQGSYHFYSIVIGRLRSKDVELGEMELDVDYVISDRPEVNAGLIGERVKMVGVAGGFLDNLLRIKRGQTLKVRTGDFNPETNTLGFGYKFQVLERTAPFKPGDFGIPPEAFRGFRGELAGKIVEAAGYEVLLEVDESKPSVSSDAPDAKSIHGKRVRIAGFYGQHGDAFADLHEGDRIRVSVAHRNPQSDALNVTDHLARVEQ